MRKIQNKYLKDLFELLEIPTISMQKEHNKDIKKACEWLANKLMQLDFEAKVLPTNGHPVVFAQNLEAGKNMPTILIYGHYDVQPPDPLDQWKSDPFKPEVRNGNIYGRGTADDKGQTYTWIAAIEEILKKDGKLPINIKFLIEGEEELGSVSLPKFVIKNKKLLRADICVISDSHCLSETKPLITYGLRGLVYTQIKVKSMPKDVHSGLYGGNVLNPANILSFIISSLKDTQNKILIPGFYRDVRKLSKTEAEDLAKFPFSVKEVLDETGAKRVVGENKFSVSARGGARPTLDVNGIWSGYTQEGQKTIIPGEASAKISMRLVPYQDPQDIFEKFEKFIRKIAPNGIDLEIELLSEGEPILMSKNSQYFRVAEEAFKKIFGSKPLYELSGGSIPITAILKNNLGMDSLLMGYGLPDDNLHSPNEKLSLAMFEKGIRTNIEFLKNLNGGK